MSRNSIWFLVALIVRSTTCITELGLTFYQSLSVIINPMSTIRSVFLNCSSNCNIHFKTLLKSLSTVNNTTEIPDKISCYGIAQDFGSGVQQQDSPTNHFLCLMDPRLLISPPKNLRSLLNSQRDYQSGKHFVHCLDMLGELEGEELQELQTVCSEEADGECKIRQLEFQSGEERHSASTA